MIRAIGLSLGVFLIAACSGPNTHTTPAATDEVADARALIDQAIAQSRSDGKHTLVVFGANWCVECHILDSELSKPPLKPVVDANFHVVHVDIGRNGTLGGLRNLDLAKKYSVALDFGIPAVAVLNASGDLLYAQKAGEWTPHGGPSAAAVLDFLNQWKPRTTKTAG